jgi:hypothetical protein
MMVLGMLLPGVLSVADSFGGVRAAGHVVPAAHAEGSTAHEVKAPGRHRRRVKDGPGQWVLSHVILSHDNVAISRDTFRIAADGHVRGETGQVTNACKG